MPTTTCLFINSERRAENLDPIEHYKHKWSPHSLSTKKLNYDATHPFSDNSSNEIFIEKALYLDALYNIHDPFS